SVQHHEHARHPVDPLVRRDDVRQEGRVAEGQHQGDDGVRPWRQPRHPPAPTWAALAPAPKNTTDLLPIATSYETAGSRTASNRAIQWGEQIVKPIFEAKDDLEVHYLLAKKLGFADLMFKNIKVENNMPVVEDVLREINRGGFS